MQSTRSAHRLARRHLIWGWWSLLFFLALGILLETLHGLKVEWYLHAANRTRRLMFTLAHAHGTLLALVHIAFALTLTRRTRPVSKRLRIASLALVGGGSLLPCGFLLGGWVVYGGDPGPGILLLPVGGLSLLGAVLLVALDTTAPPRSEEPRPDG